MKTNIYLHLNLKKEWYDMIQSGEKTEEYRDCSSYWNRIFTESGNIKIKGKYYHPTDVTITFSNGYSFDRRQMIKHITSVHTGLGKIQWGAEYNKYYHVISLK